MVSKRYARANNKYMDNYDSNKLSNRTMHLDSNYLYGWAMSQPLPVSEFQWVNNVDELQLWNIRLIAIQDIF